MRGRRRSAQKGFLAASGSALALALLAAGSATADLAHLRNGRVLAVSGYRVEGEKIVLQIEGGGEIALPREQVLEIRRAPPSETRPAGGDPSAAPPVERPTGPEEPPERTGRTDSPWDEATIDRPTAAVYDAGGLRELASRVAQRHGVDEALVQAVIAVESRYDPFAVSPRGARGLMQLMPKTAARFAVRDVFDPAENLEGGVRYLKELLERYSGQTRLALAAYNAGEEAVERFSGIPPYRETVQYVSRVLREARR